MFWHVTDGWTDGRRCRHQAEQSAWDNGPVVMLPACLGYGKKGPGKKGPGKKGPVKTVPVKTVLGKNGPGKKGPTG